MRAKKTAPFPKSAMKEKVPRAGGDGQNTTEFVAFCRRWATQRDTGESEPPMNRRLVPPAGPLTARPIPHIIRVEASSAPEKPPAGSAGERQGDSASKKERQGKKALSPAFFVSQKPIAQRVVFGIQKGREPPPPSCSCPKELSFGPTSASPPSPAFLPGGAPASPPGAAPGNRPGPRDGPPALRRTPRRCRPWWRRNPG